MPKYVPLIALAFAAFYMFRAAHLITSAEEPRPVPRQSADSSHSSKENSREPVHKVLIRLLSDMDDILDSIEGPASLPAAKQKLIKRVRQHLELAKERGNEGMQPLSKAASKEMQKAVDRHTQSMIRANQVAPGVTKFFEDELAPMLNAKSLQAN